MVRLATFPTDRGISVLNHESPVRRNIMGDWTSMGNPFAGGTELDRAYAFYSQSTFVVKVEGLEGRYVVLMDRWNTDDLSASRQVLGITLP